MSHPRVYPHDPIEEIQTDVYMARRCIEMNALMTITRNMAIVRHDGELTLVDPVLSACRPAKRSGSMHLGRSSGFCASDRCTASTTPTASIAMAQNSRRQGSREPTRSRSRRSCGTRRLLPLEFDQLLSAHGTFLPSGAHAPCESVEDQIYLR